jgi:hypothetical protein
MARFLEQRGIGCLVMKPASLQVNRRARLEYFAGGAHRNLEK